MKNITLALLVFLMGCATAGKINRVSLGMTREDVEMKMGRPTSVSATEGTEYLNYNLSETGDDAFSGRTTSYYVRLVNGRVDAYGRSGDFDSTKTPTIRIEKEESVKGDAKVDYYKELMKLNELKKEGIITEEEFQKKKREILGE